MKKLLFLLFIPTAALCQNDGGFGQRKAAIPSEETGFNRLGTSIQLVNAGDKLLLFDADGDSIIIDPAALKVLIYKDGATELMALDSTGNVRYTDGKGFNNNGSDFNAYKFGSSLGTPTINSSNKVRINIDSDGSGGTLYFEIGTNSTAETGGTTLFQVERSGGVTVTGDVNPNGDGTLDLGTQTTAQWANVWADLVNGADFALNNGWRILESDKYLGYPKGFAIGNTYFKDGVVTEKMPEQAKPVFVVTEKYIEFQGAKIFVEDFKKLAQLLKVIR